MQLFAQYLGGYIVANSLLGFRNRGRNQRIRAIWKQIALGVNPIGPTRLCLGCTVAEEASHAYS
jgi:hypothetical protein